MTRPSIAELQLQIRNLSDENIALADKLAKAEKTSTEKENSLKYTREQLEKAQSEVAQLHAAFDGIPSAPPKTYTVENSYGGTDKMERNALARFVGFLARRGASE